jgi:hypothetical protein
MGRRVRILGALVVALALLAAACGDDGGDDTTADTGVTDTDTGDGGGDDSTEGLTADTITVAVVQGDTADLQEAGVIPNTGNVASYFELFADRQNDEGGAAGRQFDVSIHDFPVPSDTTQQREACIAATEDTNAFMVVIVGGQTEETTLCITEEHERLALVLGGVAITSTFDASGGRLFTNDMSAARLMQSWVQATDDEGILADATIGIVRPDDSAHEEVSGDLTDALEEAGFEVAEEVALPCVQNGPCEQVDTGAQRLQTSGVDTVFSLLGALAYPSFVGASAAIGYDPQWLSSDYEAQVYQATADLFSAQAEDYDGAIGISTTIFIDDPDEPRIDCNDYYEEQTGESWEPLSDGWAAVGAMCLMVQRITEAADQAEESGGLTQASFIEAYEMQEVVEGERAGAFAPDKHDAYNTFQLYEFSADCVCWEPIEGTIGENVG